MSPSAGGYVLSVGIPFAAYLRTLSGSSYWLDGGEFVAAAVALDIAHPPGHPLSAVYGKLWSLVPFGSLAFRIALGQAAAAALAAGFLYLACRATAVAVGLAGAAASGVALAASLLWALSFGTWFQAVRPEVYALQGLLLLAALFGMVRFRIDRGSDTRPLYAAAFAVGLGLANHHLMSFLLFPALLLCALQAARVRGVRPLFTCAALGLLALLAYVYLPVRAATDPPANFGAPSTLERFLWVLSARVYAKNVGGHDPVPFEERFLDLLLAVTQDLHAVPLLAAVFGAYAALRHAPSRRAAVLWLIVASTVLATRGWLGSVRGNPDALGYALCGTAALSALASAGVSALLAALSPAQPRGEARPSSIRLRAPFPLAASCAVAVLALQLATTFPRADLSRFFGTDAFDELRVRELPTRSVMVAATPQAVFRHLELAATEAVRPDVVLVPLPFLGYPGVSAAVTRAHPELRALVERFEGSHALSFGAALDLAARRPVLTELEAHVPPSVYPALLPAGLLYAVVNPRVREPALPRAEALQQRTEARLATLLGDAAERETERQRLWVHYMGALYYAAHGRHELAHRSLEQAARLFPHDAHVEALRRALAAHEGALDVRPFLTAAGP